MCVFCKIVENEIPSFKIYEDDLFTVILDISQASRGHTLVIPKKHYENIYELDNTVATEIGSVIVKISNALKSAFDARGLNILNNNGSLAGQSVMHFHVHLIPRYEDDPIEFYLQNNDGKILPSEFKEMQVRIKEFI